MNKKLIIIGLINCLILAAVAFFFVKNGNQESYGSMDLQPAQPKQGEGWKLVKSITIDLEGAKYIALKGEDIYVVNKDSVLLYNMEGDIIGETASMTEEQFTAIAYLNDIAVILRQGLLYWGELNQDYGKQSYITDVALLGESLILADAGQRKLLVCNLQGEIQSEIAAYEGHGFKVPSPYFSLSVSEDGELWVTDPGRKCFVHFDAEGKYRATWQPQDEQAFLGCCNPARMRCLAGGRFATLEKGQVRVRIFSPSGAVESTVADFGVQQNFNYDMAVKDEHNIFILDGNNQQIHLYHKN